MRATPLRDRGDGRATGQPLGRSTYQPGLRRGRDGLRRKAHSEHLPSFADTKAPRAFHHHPAQRPSLGLHYQCRDYAPLQSRPPCLCSLIAAASRSHTARTFLVGCAHPTCRQSRPAPGAGMVCGAKRMPSLRSERERREMQAVRPIFILSRFASFPACLAAGPACVLTRLCAFVEQITLPLLAHCCWTPLPRSQ